MLANAMNQPRSDLLIHRFRQQVGIYRALCFGNKSAFAGAEFRRNRSAGLRLKPLFPEPLVQRVPTHPQAFRQLRDVPACGL